MAYTSEQVRQIYNARMRTMMQKIAKDKQDQLDREREEQKKHNQFIGTLNLAAGAANMSSDWYDRIVSKKLRVEYGGADEILPSGERPKKYQEDISDRGWLPEGFLPGGKKPKLGKIGATVFPPIEETPHYKEFKAEKVKAAEELKLKQATWPKTEEAIRGEEISKTINPITGEPFAVPSEISSTDFTAMSPEQKLQLKQKRENLKLVQEGILTEAEVIEMENKGLRFNPETNQFEPITEMDPAEIEKLRLELEEEQRIRLEAEQKAAEEFYAQDPITGEPLAAPGEISPTDFTVMSPDQQLQLKREQAGFDLGQLTTEAEALNIDPITGQPLPVKGEISPTDYTVKSNLYEGGYGELLEMDMEPEDIDAYRQIMETGEVPEGFEWMKGYPGIKARLDEKIGTTKYIPEIDIESEDLDLGRRIPDLPESVGFVPELVGPGVVPDVALTGEMLGASKGGRTSYPFEYSKTYTGTPEVPDAKPGLFGKAFDAGQTAFQLKNIGDIIADKDATDEQKVVASVQGTKVLNDLALKHAGKESAEAFIKANTIKKGGELTLKEGAKLGLKQTTGAVLGGALGAHTLVTEGKEMSESYKEKDYDEAILHGMAAGSGGLQMGGAGMMATGIGAPLGAILFGIGTAGSLISTAGLFLEGLFGDKGEPAKPDKPKFDASRYFDTIRSSRRY